jgi:hypothetical protein
LLGQRDRTTASVHIIAKVPYYNDTGAQYSGLEQSSPNFLITDVISIKIIITHAQYKSLSLCIDDLFINYICTYTYIQTHTTIYVILELGLRGVFFPLPHGTSREPLRVRAPHFGEDWLRTSAVYRLQKYITQETCVIQYSS